MSKDVSETTEAIVKPPRQHRVLVLDGDEQEVELLRQHLKGTGYQTISASCASEALAQIEDKEVDLSFAGGFAAAARRLPCRLYS